MDADLREVAASVVHGLTLSNEVVVVAALQMNDEEVVEVEDVGRAQDQLEMVTRIRQHRLL